MLTLDQIEEWRKEFNRDPDDMYSPGAIQELRSLCDLAKLALSPPQDVAGLVEAIRNYEQASMDGTFVKVSRQACDEAADALLSLSARNARLEAEVSRLTNLAQEGENRGLEKAAKIADDEPEYPDWGESNNLKYRHYTAKEIAMASCQATKDCIAQKIRALIPQEQGEKGK